jgi:hypothetical protein
MRSRPHDRLGSALALALTLAGLASVSCFATPEACHICQAMPDAATDQRGAGGLLSASGGATGTGGTLGSTGGMASSAGGGLGSAGTFATGGAFGSGGAAGHDGVNPAGGAPGVGGGGRGAGDGGSKGSGGAGSGGQRTGSGGAGGGMASGGAPGTAGAAGATAAMGGNGGRAGAGGAAGALDPALVLWYKFDESAGTTAGDSAMFGGMARNGALATASTGTATFSTMARVGSHAVSLTGTSSTAGGYVSIPTLAVLAPDAVTITCWVYIRSDASWQRVFHLGVEATSPVKYMFLTTHQGTTSPPSVRFVITTTGNATSEDINMTSPALLTLNAWHHVAVTLAAGSPYTGTLYIDRVVAGTNTRMTLHASDLGTTGDNYLGKSPFTQDPYLNGAIDDFRVYRRALTAAEIAALPP